ncbi:MAG: DUF4974 domain-containing protein [Bacteroidales bacterium]|nr:DUF4974 domain-containing protein [Bacteroidales bacterium]
MTGKHKYKYIDPQIVRNYLESEGNKAGQHQIAKWFSDMLANEELRDFTSKQWAKLSENSVRKDYDEDRIHDRIHHLLRLEEAAAIKKDRVKILRFCQRAAAVLIIPLALFALLNLDGSLGSQQNNSGAMICAPPGARTNFTLPDGSEGWLNVGSYLSFPAKFTGKRRTVKLVGEAYFDVKSNPKKPFIVESEGINVKVHGTTFNIMAYPEETTIEVSLESGKIEVLNKRNCRSEESLGLLAPGEVGVYLKESNFFKIDKEKIDSHTAWKEGKLVLDNEPMDQVVRKLNRWYNVEIILKDSQLKDFAYHATFVDEKLDEVLEIFSLTSPISYKKLNREKYADGTYKKRVIELYYDPK